MTTPVFRQRDPDARGYFGPYGGRFVPETLVAPVEALAAAYDEARADPAFARRLGDLLDRLFPGHVPAADAASAQHQVRVVEQGQGPLEERLDDGGLRVVDEDQDVGHLQDRPPAHLHPRRQAPGVGPFRRADQGRGPRRIAVALQVEGRDQTLARGGVGRAPVDQHEAGLQGPQHPLPEVALHVIMDGADAPAAARGLQEGLGEDQAQGGGAVAHEARRLLPVLRVGGVLVAGDDRPLLQAHVRARQQHAGYAQTDVGEAHGGRV